MTPLPSAAIRSMAVCSCSRQSHLREPITSEVQHSEWTRARTFAMPATWPRTSAMCSREQTGLAQVTASIGSRYTMIRNVPYTVGISASE